MAFMEWSDKLSVGIKSIDDQHKKLVSMVNELHDAMSERKGSEVLEGILSRLIDYTKSHFKTEEDLMQKHAYPGFVAHKSAHSQLTEKALDLQLDLKAGKAALSIQVFGFLKAWLVNHIQGEDMKYGPFLVKQGVA